VRQLRRHQRLQLSPATTQHTRVAARLISVKPILTAALIVCAAAAQPPAVGDINLYGLHKVTAAHILSTLNLKPGAGLPPSKGAMEDALEKIPNVVLARVEAVCCDGPQATLFIGIEERGASHASFRSEPTGDASLPQDLVDSYHQFLAVVARATALKTISEDLTAGHSLLSDPEARKFQDQFADFAAGHLDSLRNVLETGGDAAQRAVAAAVIGYAPRKQDVLGELQLTLQDPDESVRANAVRSLLAIAVLAAKSPGLNLRIPPVWLIELLNSVVLSDRFESSKVLLTLTDREDASLLAQLRERAVQPLAEMARWKTPRYALPAFLLLGRLANMPDAAVHAAWEKGDREQVITKALQYK